MSFKLRNVAALTALLVLAGCTSPTNQLTPNAEQVHVRMDSGFDANQCQWLGEVTGSEGHWYSYLFFTNDVMIEGAINNLKNNAAKLGADTVYMIAPQDFVTSFTVLGSAYHCHNGG
ncbi:DUF4156 domain-containing protein [Vibrio sp. TRT 21S02]|uniref:DUF4156 domain-containing protein n=1 Tax=Vibrio sp. TRT 21S02 TaxID=3418507 RepID=UPI003CE6F8F4